MNPKPPLSTITVYRLVASFILAISIYSCANMSRPGGGPREGPQRTKPACIHQEHAGS